MAWLKYNARKTHPLYNFLRELMQPNDWSCSIENSKTLRIVFFGCILFCVCGTILYQKWTFPHFFEFVFVFAFIGIISFFCVIHFSKEITHIVTAVANQPGAKKANHIYYTYCKDSPLYVIAPMAIILIFGIGGCSMFGAISINPTLIWILILFFLVVYISIIGYLQYIVLIIYIWKLASGSGRYKRLPKSMVECIPAQLEWIQRLTKLSHTYRSSFFTLGSAYIIAFGAFCWLPKMQANTSTPAFFLLWGIIFVVIVLLFPIASVLEYRWIKQIVEHLKASYIEDLVWESKINRKATSTVFSPAAERSVQTLCAMQIMNSMDYPIKSILATWYATLLSVLNFGAATVTIIQAIPSLSNVLPQTL